QLSTCRLGPGPDCAGLKRPGPRVPPECCTSHQGKSLKAYNNEDLRLAAKRALPRGLYEYIARGSEDETALGRNRRALDAIKFRPKVFVNVAGRNQRTTVLGKEQALPLIIAPTGAVGLMWYQGEIALA